MKEISKKNFDGYKYVDGGVCAAKGFKANGLSQLPAIPFLLPDALFSICKKASYSP